MVFKPKTGYNISTCDRCQETHLPVKKYKKEYLCFSCLENRKREPLAIKKIKDEEESKARWDELVGLPDKPA